MFRYRTTKEIMEMEGCSRYTAVVWAAKNRVLKFGTQYEWTPSNVKSFQNRNKVVGAPKGKRSKKK